MASAFSDGLEAVAGYGARAPYAEARSRERLTVNHTVRKSEGFSHYANLVLVEKLYRLHQLELKVFRQSAYVVVCLDSVAFENVRIDGALREEFHAVQLSRLFLENSYELGSDNLSLGFGIVDSRQLVKESVYGVYVDQIGVHLIAENRNYLLRLSFSEKTVVYVHADELLSDGFNEQRRYHGGIHASGESQQDFLVAYLFSDGFHLFIYKLLCQRPVVIRCISSGLLLLSILPPYFITLFEVSLSITSWAPPSTMEVAETSVSLAFCCSSLMLRAPQLHMVDFTLVRERFTLSCREPA